MNKRLNQWCSFNIKIMINIPPKLHPWTRCTPQCPQIQGRSVHFGIQNQPLQVQNQFRVSLQWVPILATLGAQFLGAGTSQTTHLLGHVHSAIENGKKLIIQLHKFLKKYYKNYTIILSSHFILLEMKTLSMLFSSIQNSLDIHLDKIHKPGIWYDFYNTLQLLWGEKQTNNQNRLSKHKCNHIFPKNWNILDDWGVKTISPLARSHLQHEAVVMVLFATFHKELCFDHCLPRQYHHLHKLEFFSAVVIASETVNTTNKSNV